MQNARLDEAQAGIKVGGRNNKLTYADYTTLKTESEEELKSLLMKVKEKSVKNWLKTQHSKSEDHGPSWKIDGSTLGRLRDFILLGFKITVDDCRELQP